MKWGISFKIPAIYESDLLGLPPPSNIIRLSGGKGRNKSIEVFYHFSHNPQSWKEWQRVAAIKSQIKQRVSHAIFTEYEALEIGDKIYTISELGKHFTNFVKFPKPLFPSVKREAYKMLCRHSVRLYYMGLLYEEQLIATSFRFNQTEAKEGMTQTLKRAKAAYKYALDNCSTWKIKLGDDERHKVLSNAALKSAEAKRKNSKDLRAKAKTLRENGQTLQNISEKIGVSKSTVKRWLKGH